MRLSEFYEGLQKSAEAEEVEGVEEELDIDKVAFASAVIGEMTEEEREQLATALATGEEVEEPVVEKDASEVEAADDDEEIMKRAEDIYVAGRIFARGVAAEMTEE